MFKVNVIEFRKTTERGSFIKGVILYVRWKENDTHNGEVRCDFCRVASQFRKEFKFVAEIFLASFCQIWIQSNFVLISEHPAYKRKNGERRLLHKVSALSLILLSWGWSNERSTSEWDPILLKVKFEIVYYCISCVNLNGNNVLHRQCLWLTLMCSFVTLFNLYFQQGKN